MAPPRLTIVRRYDTDPPSPPRGPRVTPIFDARRERNMDMPDHLWNLFARELIHPSDQLLVATLVAHGHPREHAEELRHFAKARMGAYRFWLNVQEAARGNHEAQEWVDRAREAWDHRRGVALEEHMFGREL